MKFFFYIFIYITNIKLAVNCTLIDDFKWICVKLNQCTCMDRILQLIHQTSKFILKIIKKNKNALYDWWIILGLLHTGNFTVKEILCTHTLPVQGSKSPFIKPSHLFSMTASTYSVQYLLLRQGPLHGV